MAFKVGDEVLCFLPGGEMYFGVIDHLRAEAVSYPICVNTTKYWNIHTGLREDMPSAILTNSSELVLSTNFSQLERLIYGI